MVRGMFVIAALLLAAAGIASALSELATLRGNHAVRSTLEHPMRATSLVGVPATNPGSVA